MLTWIDATSSFTGPVPIGAVPEAGAAGHVTASRHPGFAVGEHVYGGFGVQDFARSDGTGVTRLDPLSAYLGARHHRPDRVLQDARRRGPAGRP